MKTGWVVTLFLSLVLPFPFLQACSTSGGAQRQSSGQEYEVTDLEKAQKQDSLLVEKYASILNTPTEEIRQSFALYEFIDQQVSTPCTATQGKNTTSDVQLTQYIFEQVYNRKVPASYEELKQSQLLPKFSDRSYLAEGDLIFFEEEVENQSQGTSNSPSLKATVGMYLRNDKFVICSEKAGAVVVNDLSSRYWDKRYKMAGRLRIN